MTSNSRRYAHCTPPSKPSTCNLQKTAGLLPVASTLAVPSLSNSVVGNKDRHAVLSLSCKDLCAWSAPCCLQLCRQGKTS